MKPEPASILLVAPQNLAYLSALVSQMTGMGHTVTPAHSPAEALALARARPFDLILLDATAPHSTPLEL
ncbi:MAG: hypothetical protein ACE5G8_18200, partial [Anaerolineae bacterium]